MTRSNSNSSSSPTPSLSKMSSLSSSTTSSRNEASSSSKKRGKYKVKLSTSKVADSPPRTPEAWVEDIVNENNNNNNNHSHHLSETNATTTINAINNNNNNNNDDDDDNMDAIVVTAEMVTHFRARPRRNTEPLCDVVEDKRKNPIDSTSKENAISAAASSSSTISSPLKEDDVVSTNRDGEESDDDKGGGDSTTGGKRRSSNKSSNYRGVSKCNKDGRWQSRIRVGNKVCYLGRFRTEELAARAYDFATLEMNKGNPVNFLNFSDSTLMTENSAIVAEANFAQIAMKIRDSLSLPSPTSVGGLMSVSSSLAPSPTLPAIPSSSVTTKSSKSSSLKRKSAPSAHEITIHAEKTSTSNTTATVTATNNAAIKPRPKKVSKQLHFRSLSLIDGSYSVDTDVKSEFSFSTNSSVQNSPTAFSLYKRIPSSSQLGLLDLSAGSGMPSSLSMTDGNDVAAAHGLLFLSCSGTNLDGF